MKRIFILIQPFDHLQHIEIFDGSSIIETAQISMTDIPEQLCLFANKYNEMMQVNLLGPSKYINKIEKETKQKEIEKYQKNILTFKYI